MRKLTILLVLSALISVSCSGDKKPVKVYFSGQAQGTYYAITYYDIDGYNYKADIDLLLDNYDKSVSVYLENSIISRINSNDTAVVTDSYFNENFNKSIEVSGKTNGAFDVTVGPFINAWGFGLEKKADIDSLMIDSIMEFIGYQKISLKNNKVIKQDPRMMINFNAIAQGYSADIVGKFLESKGINNYLVDIGGEVLAKGTKENDDPWVVGIQLPTQTKHGKIEAEAKIYLRNKALATSGSYRRYYEEDGLRYSHTIDPSTGYPVKHSLLSVSVLAADAITADAYATAFMVMGVEKSVEFLKTDKDLDAYFIFSTEDGKFATYATNGIKQLLCQ